MRSRSWLSVALMLCAMAWMLDACTPQQPAHEEKTAAQDASREAQVGDPRAPGPEPRSEPAGDGPPADDGPTGRPDAQPPKERVQESKPPVRESSAEKKADKFSFFVTSLEAMQKLSGSKDGFGGNLGGLAGADKICQDIAKSVGAGHKTWRAFLSVTKGPDGKPVHAIDRVGKGPWYDRNGRLVAKDVQGLVATRPDGDPQTIYDLPNEHGQPQHQFGDNHDIMTGSNKQGRLNSSDPLSTCQDWTSSDPKGTANKVMCGHSWPRGGGTGRPDGRGAHWLSDHALRGCSAGVNLKNDGRGSGDCVGCSGGYGGLYCFALSP